MSLTIQKSKIWFWLPSFYRYKEISEVRKWDIYWLNLTLIYHKNIGI
jgi:hypothetical protein